MVVKDMIFNREADNRIYNAAYTRRSDGNCKVNETAFTCVYLDVSSLNEPTAIVTTYDRITKAQTNGTAQQLSVSECKECKSVYISDNKVVYIYCDAASGALLARVGTAAGTVLTFGTESADIVNGLWTVQHFDACKIDDTHIGVIGVFNSVADFYPAICAVVFEISGTSISAFGSTLEIAERLSPIADGYQFGISAFNSSSVGIVYWEDNFTTANTVKLDLTGNELALNQTTLLLATYLYPNPGIVCINETLAFVGFTPDDRPATYNTFALIDYSGTIPVIIQSENFASTSNSYWFFSVISNGSAVIVKDNFEIAEVSIMIANMYGNTYQINYTSSDVYYNNKCCLGIHKLNTGEMVLFLDDYTIISPTLYNIDANLISFLGGVSMPDFLEYGQTLDFGSIEVGQTKTEEVTLQNDGLYPEDIDISCNSFYFADNSDLLSRSASVRVRSIPILTDTNYDYLTDPKGNVLKAIL